MSSINCESCDNLRNHAPEFVQNGVTNNICTSLQNDTGLNPTLTRLHNDEEDMHDINDCTIGRMAQEIDAYDVCDWKEFMKRFIPNLYEYNKANNCVDAGQWDNIHKLWCYMEYMMEKPQSYQVHVYEDDDPSKPAINGFRIAQGVRMRQPGTPGNAPITMNIFGDHMKMTGSLEFYGNMPSDYTNGQTVAWSHLQEGSSAITNRAGQSWGTDGHCWTCPLVYEYQITPSEYGFESIWSAPRLTQDQAGDFGMRVMIFKKGDTVPPDYTIARVDGEYPPGSYTYNPSDSKKILIQVRLQDTRHALGGVTPWGIGIVIPYTKGWKC